MRSRWRQGRLALAAIAFCASGCAPRTCLTFRAPMKPPPRESVEVTFLGVGGILIRWWDQAVMTPPLYSNPTAGELALVDFYPDTERIDRFLRADLSGLKAILVGHAHYDHAMDIPYIAAHKAPRAGIYGSQTLVHALAPMGSELGARNPLYPVDRDALCRVEDPLVDPCAGTANPCASAHPIEIPGERFRVWPIASEHAPQIGPGMFLGPFKDLSPDAPVTFWRGQLLAPARTLPTRVGGWPAGSVLAYVIELLDDDKQPVFRIYYQDSPTRSPIGYPPACLRPIDLAVLCMGGSTELPDFPRDIVEAIDPRFVMGTHWEDFLNPRALPVSGATDVEEKTRAVHGVKASRFRRAVRGSLSQGGRVSVPCPEDVTRFTREGGSWAIDTAGTRPPWERD